MLYFLFRINVISITYLIEDVTYKLRIFSMFYNSDNLLSFIQKARLNLPIDLRSRSSLSASINIVAKLTMSIQKKEEGQSLSRMKFYLFFDAPVR